MGESTAEELGQRGFKVALRCVGDAEDFSRVMVEIVPPVADTREFEKILGMYGLVRNLLNTGLSTRLKFLPHIPERTECAQDNDAMKLTREHIGEVLSPNGLVQIEFVEQTRLG